MSDTAWQPADLRQFAAAYLASARGVLAAMATAEYQRQGRGLIALSIRGPRPAADEPLELRYTQMGYRPRAQYVRMTRPLLQTASRHLVERTITAIDQYDPSTEMVVAFVAGPAFLTLAGAVPLSASAATQPRWVM